jgi:enolase
MAKIVSVKSNQILDSMGTVTLEIVVVLDNDIVGNAAVTNDSFGTKQLMQTLDDDPRKNWETTISQSKAIIENQVQKALVGLDNSSQTSIDTMLVDSYVQDIKSKMPKIFLLATSMAVASATAKSEKKELFQYVHTLLHRDSESLKIPVPAFTLLDTSSQSAYTADFAEFYCIPASFKKFEESLAIGRSMHEAVRTLLNRESLSTLMSAKGGFAPILSSNEDALSLLKQAAESINIRTGYDMYFGIDATAYNFYKDKHYKIRDKTMSIDANELSNIYTELCKKYHILYIEDPLHPEDVDKWSSLSNSLNQQANIVGDTLVSADPLKLQMALQKKAISGIVISPQYLTTVTEGLVIAEMARTAGLKTTVTSGISETNDTFFADFAVAIEADYVTFGATTRGERIAKYNRLIEIERILKN